MKYMQNKKQKKKAKLWQQKYQNDKQKTFNM
jgi:hypothetical protein